MGCFVGMLENDVINTEFHKEINELEQIIVHTLDKNKNVLIKGSRGYGKTFLLKRISENIRNNNTYTIYINSKDKNAYIDFINQLLKIYQLHKNYTVFNKEILELLLSKVNKNSKDELYILFYYIRQIIKDITLYSKLIVLIDDIQYQDEYIIDLITFLLKEKLYEGFNFVIAYSESLNINFIKFIEDIKKFDFEEFKLKGICEKI
ncbi:ATP-binding protein [Caloramator sp. mosi_1]|uniref:ATP-binding protein n=1 Tax=Caloramator sp. mosi_1 TaxID=3023090 RepID=UPI00235FBFBF|nr:ATP-binding protein [Caloramator sp. mosi_1]WDC83178.1 ATP-binding protein [Caloramator sp. mosi_1]